jgi:hypothetical protein
MKIFDESNLHDVRSNVRKYIKPRKQVSGGSDICILNLTFTLILLTVIFIIALFTMFHSDWKTSLDNSESLLYNVALGSGAAVVILSLWIYLSE